MKYILLLQLGDMNESLYSVRCVTSIVSYYSEAQVFLLCNELTKPFHTLLQGTAGVFTLSSNTEEREKLVNSLGVITSQHGFDLVINLGISRKNDIDDLVNEIQGKEKIGTNLFSGVRNAFEIEYYDSCYSKLILLPPIAQTADDYYSKFLGELSIPCVDFSGISIDVPVDSITQEPVCNLQNYIVFISTKDSLYSYPSLKEIIRKVKTTYEVQIILINNDAEQFLTEDIDLLLIYDHTISRFGEIASLINNARMVVGVESPYLLFARLSGIPTVGIMGGSQFTKGFVHTQNTTLIYLPMKCFDCGNICKFSTPFCIREIDPEIVLQEVDRVYKSKQHMMRVVNQKDFLWRFDSGLLAFLDIKGLIGEECEFIEIENEERDYRFAQRNYEILTSGMTVEEVQLLNQHRFHIDSIQTGTDITLDHEELEIHKKLGPQIRENLQRSDALDYKDPFIYYLLGVISFHDHLYAESARNLMVSFHKGLGSLWLLRRIAKVAYMAGCELLSYEIMKNFQQAFLDDSEISLFQSLQRKFSGSQAEVTSADQLNNLSPEFAVLIDQVGNSLSNNDLTDALRRLQILKHEIKQKDTADSTSYRVIFQHYCWLKAKYHFLKKEYKSSLLNYESSIQSTSPPKEMLTEYASLLRKTGRKIEANRVERMVKQAYSL